jgi:alpha-tubulin suppressor-like RCC1 family protein
LRIPTKVESLNGQKIGLVAAGDHHSVAVSRSGDHLWMWGNGPAGTFCDPFVKYLPYPSQIEEVNYWLHHEHKTIANIKASGDSTVALTTDGELWGWGGNQYGQLANNHDRLMLAYKGVYEPYHVSGYEGNIKGYDLSEDVIVFWTGKFKYLNEKIIKSLNI